MPTPCRAAIYARISNDREGEAAGVGRQIADCRAEVERRGWHLVETYVDNDLSAYRGKPRPAYRRLCEDIKAGDLDALVYWHADRLHRHPAELESFIDLADASATVLVSVHTGIVDLTTGDGRCFARIVGAMAAKESDDKSRRIRRKHQELALAGKRSGGGTRPFGYDVGRRRIVPAEAAVIREAAERVLAGDHLRSICNDLNDRGVRTVTGKEWSTHVLRRILMSGSVSGQREHQGEIVAPAEWPPILRPEQTARLRAILGDPARRTNARPARNYLLGHLLRCGLCGAELVSRPRSDGRRTYICAKGPGLPGCNRIKILADDLEAFVIEAVLHRLDTPELQKAMSDAGTQDAEAAELTRQLAEDQAQLNELADAYGRKAFSLSEWMSARKPIEARMHAARRRLARINHHSVLDGFLGASETLRTQWSSLPLNRQRAIIAAVLHHVTVNSAVRGRNRFDESRLDVLWKGELLP